MTTTSPSKTYTDIFITLKLENFQWVAEAFEDWPSTAARSIAHATLPDLDTSQLADPRLSIDTPSAEAIQAHGRYLFEWLFRDELGAALRERIERATRSDAPYHRLRIHLCFASDIVGSLEYPSVHWEALLLPEWLEREKQAHAAKPPRRPQLPPRIESPFLALNPSIELIRRLTGARVDAELAVAEPLRLAIVRCNPEPDMQGQYPDLEPHLTDLHERVSAGLEILRKDGLVELTADLANPTAEECLSALKRSDPHVFIFLGHGYGHEHGYSRGGLVLRRGAQPEPFLEFLELAKAVRGQSLRLAVLIACHSASAAPHLLKAGVPAVLGMSLSEPLAFPTRSAKRFIEVLFRELALFRSLEESLVEARAALAREQPQFPDWLIPQLWLASPDGHLLKPDDVRRGQYRRFVQAQCEPFPVPQFVKEGMTVRAAAEAKVAERRDDQKKTSEAEAATDLTTWRFGSAEPAAQTVKEALEAMARREHSRHAVITGEAGDGKSTLLRKLGLGYLDAGRYPLLLNIRRWEEGGLTLEAYLKEGAFLEDSGIPKEFALWLWGRVMMGEAPVLMDGLDEASDTGSIAERIQRFAAGNHHRHLPQKRLSPPNAGISRGGTAAA